MKTDPAIVKLIAEAVVDVVKAALPALVREACFAEMADMRGSLVDAMNRMTAITLAADTARAASNGAVAQLAAAHTGVVSEVHASLADLERGIAGQVAAAVRAAVEALPPPAAGKQGEPGADGRDAVFTEPVPWVAGRLFARGAVVQHKNALWHANVPTDREPGAATCGYSLIVDGALPAAVEADDTGALFLRFEFASGVSQRWPLGFRPLRHVGIWDAARDYHENDCVTCDGSMWRARADATDARPGTDAGGAVWQLIVKRGKDGKDGRDGRDGKDAATPTPARSARAAANGGAA